MPLSRQLYLHISPCARDLEERPKRSTYQTLTPMVTKMTSRCEGRKAKVSSRQIKVFKHYYISAWWREYPIILNCISPDLQLSACWNCGFEFRRGHGCLSHANCCDVM